MLQLLLLGFRKAQKTLFNLFINDPVLFLTETMLINYNDDDNLFSIGKDINKVKDTLAKDFEIVSNSFYENFMVLNSKKCYFICIGRVVENETLLLNIYVIKTARKKLFWG